MYAVLFMYYLCHETKSKANISQWFKQYKFQGLSVSFKLKSLDESDLVRPF